MTPGLGGALPGGWREGGRISLWTIDVGLAVGVAVAGILPTGHWVPWAYPLAFAAGLALVARRRYPRTVVLATFPALLGALGTIAAGAALYALGRARPSYRAVVPWVIASMVVTLLPVVYRDIQTDLGPAQWGDWVVTVLVVLLMTGGPAAAGALAATRMQLTASLEALHVTEADRDREVAARVRAEERNRIAREVHDIVGHYTSLIAVQASALESTATDVATKQTAARLRELSSRALDEMRAAVTDWVGGPRGGGWTRWVLQPAVAANQSGVDVQISQSDSLPENIDEAAVRVLRRVVQEGVTNAVKHCPGVQLQVQLWADEAKLQLVMRNPVPADHVASNGGTGGSGLTGLTDRIGPLGGAVSAGLTDDGHWTLAAQVPVAS